LPFVVLYAFQVLVVPPPAPGPERVASETTDVPAFEPAPRAAPTELPSEPDPENEALVGEEAERQITVETATVHAVFTNRGGKLLSWRLKDYADDTGEPIDLIPSVPDEHPRPFLLQVDDAELTARLNSALYRVTGEADGVVDATTDSAVLVFEYQDSTGVQARKELQFDPDDYVVTFSAAVKHGDQDLNPTVLWGPGLSDLGAVSSGGSVLFAGYVQAPQGIYHRNDDVERLASSTLVTQPVHEGQFRFAGIDDHYFIAAAVTPGQARLEYRPVTLSAETEEPRHFVAFSIQLPESPRDVRFFVGPKKFERLQAVDAELVRAIHFGIFGFLAVPLLNALNWIHGYVGNYGWSIVILTILINLSLFYFRHKSVVSMRKMQALQPQLKAIQERYKGLKVTDPARQKMNTEIMSLYREKGVNPASGCLPMVMMMPVLIAFYSFLSVAIELRGAEFGWWIQDLSRPDPYFVVPILMGVTMFWQQKITPTTGDPMQQRIMLIMPVMFTFMFLWFPSGLVIYWFTSNLWAIGQQYFTYWLIGPPVPVAPRPPAERRLKNAGRGRSVGVEKRT
jgi:YidC/Oxa1 family membrane protein insertase